MGAAWSHSRSPMGRFTHSLPCGNLSQTKRRLRNGEYGENAELSPNSLRHLLACQVKAFWKLSSQEDAERHFHHPSDSDECTFAETLAKQLCLPDPYLVYLRNGDALAHWFSDGQGSSMSSLTHQVRVLKGDKDVFKAQPCPRAQ